MTELPFSLEQRIVVRARRATVFRYFTDSERFAAWWGKGSHIDARPGGAVLICYPGNVRAFGSVVELVPDERIVFTYGYEDPAKPIAPGGSLVTIRLRDVSEGTEVHLRHDVAEEATRESHAPGWRFQLALFANIVASEQHAAYPERVTDWFEAWRAPDLAGTIAALERSASPEVTFRDRWACISGLRVLAEHIHIARRHMPGLLLFPHGAPKACQGTVVAPWATKDAGDKVLATGVNVLELDADGRILRVVGIAD